MSNTIKTTLLLGALTGLLIGFGYVFAGPYGAVGALVVAAVMNFGMYWFSDRIVLSQMGAEEVSKQENPRIHRIVERLAQQANIPKPKVYLVPDETPNAFATGRNPENAAIGVTRGILNLLDEDELEGVLAHELSHVMNRDTLISAIAATLAGAIALLGMVARWGAIFGGRGGGRNNIFVLLVMGIVTPLIATVVKAAISRSREFKADSSGGNLCGKPMSLARALEKLHSTNERHPMQRASENTAHMFIVNPLSAKKTFFSIFSTHPPVEDRIEALQNQAMGRQSG